MEYLNEDHLEVWKSGRKINVLFLFYFIEIIPIHFQFQYYSRVK